MVTVLPDAEVVGVQWAIDDPDINTLVGSRVATNLPQDPFPSGQTVPFLTVFRVGGSPEFPFEGLIDRALLQFDCYGAKGGYREASELARTVVAKLHAFTGTVVGAGPQNSAWVYGFEVLTGPRRIHEPETGWARYIVEAFINMRASE